MDNLTEHETRFFNLFYLFVMCGVRDRDIPFMLWHFSCGLTQRQIAINNEISFELVRQRVTRAQERMKVSRFGKDIIKDFYK